MKDLAKQAYDRAFAYEGSVKGCAQCVLSALMETIGGVTPAVIKAATGMAAGVAQSGNACGAFTGGVLAIGCFIGREYDNLKDEEGIRFETFRLARKLLAKFEDAYGNCNCAKIQEKLCGRSFRMSELSEREAFAAAGAYIDKCTNVVGNAAAWVVEILEEEGLLKDVK